MFAFLIKILINLGSISFVKLNTGIDMEPASLGLTPTVLPQQDATAPGTGTLDSLHLTVKNKDPSAGLVVREESPGTFSVLQDAIPPYQAIQDAIKKSTGQDVKEGLIFDIHGTFERDANDGVVAETFKKDRREFIKFAVTWNVSIHTDEGLQVIKVKQNVFTGVELPALTSDKPDYDPVAELEEAKNKAYLLAKSYELTQRVGHSAVEQGEINQKIRNCANLIFSPVANPTSLRQDEPFAAQHNFRQLKVCLPDGGLVDKVLDLGERFYEDDNQLNPSSFSKEITGQFVVLKTTSRGVNDFDAMELSGEAALDKVVDHPDLQAKYIKFLKDKDTAYLKEKNRLTTALNTLMGERSPLLTRLQDPAISQLVDEYVKARKDYAGVKEEYTAAKGPIERELINRFDQAQKLRDQKAKELKQLTGLGALGMIATRLQTLNSRLEKNIDILAAFGTESEQEIEKTDVLTDRLKAQIRDFKDREIGLLKVKVLLTQVEGPEAQEAVNSLLAAAAIGGAVGTDFESILASVPSTLASSERITDVFDELASGVAEPLVTLDTSEPTPTTLETVRETSERSMTSAAKAAYSAVSSVFSMFGSGIRQMTKGVDWQALDDASEMMHFGEVISPRDETPSSF